MSFFPQRRLLSPCGAALLLWLAAAALACPARADVRLPARLRPRGYVSDFAQVIEPEWAERLNRLATLLDRKTKAQVAVVTIPSLEGEPIEDFANRLFEAWGIGHRDNRGVLLVLVIKERRSKLEVGYGLEPIIPNGFAGSVLREMRPALRERKYGEALYAGCSLLAERVAKESGVKLDDASLYQSHRRGTREPNWVVILLIVAAVFLGLPWWLAMMGAGYARRPHRISGFGAFGDYDAGGCKGGFGGRGGFAGFGGGLSGGGGASSDW